MDDFIREFSSETRQALARLEPALQALEAGAGDVEALASIHRTMYAVAALAGILAISDVADVARRCEQGLSLLRSRRVQVDRERVDVIRRAFDAIWAMLAERQRVEWSASKLGRREGPATSFH